MSCRLKIFLAVLHTSPLVGDSLSSLFAKFNRHPRKSMILFAKKIITKMNTIFEKSFFK